MKWLAIVLMTVGFANLTLADDAAKTEPAQSRISIYANAYYHSESRLDASDSYRVTARNSEFSLGVDFLLSPQSNLYLGGRLGIFREQVLTTVPVGMPDSRPFVGGQFYKLLPVGTSFAFKFGGALDLILPPKGISEPLWLYVGGLTGFRWKTTERFYIEVPAELGLTPFFDSFASPPVFFKFGLQFGVSL